MGSQAEKKSSYPTVRVPDFTETESLLTGDQAETMLVCYRVDFLPGGATAAGDALSHNITHLLKEWSAGDRRALDKLTPLVYEELRHQAARYLRRERPNHTLQTTALIHEAYLRLIDARDVQWQSRAHFFAIAANLMRRILVDHARRRDAEKRSGTHIRLPLDEALTVAQETEIDLLAIDEALDRLAAIDPQQARVVELRFFSGLSVEETAAALGVSPKTVKRDWSVARAWLRREIGGQTISGRK
jgi:RNA polymerase sigma factor (TIGR02999 family)